MDADLFVGDADNCAVVDHVINPAVTITDVNAGVKQVHSHLIGVLSLTN
jgi:hypothetical protein